MSYGDQAIARLYLKSRNTEGLFKAIANTLCCELKKVVEALLPRNKSCDLLLCEPADYDYVTG